MDKKLLLIVVLLMVVMVVVNRFRNNDKHLDASLETALKDPAHLVIDVRTLSEFESGHIEGALLIPHDVIAENISEEVPHLDTPIIVYCRTGNRSGMAKKTLDQMGYTNVINAGGYNQFKEQLSLR